ncbi:hypothetical protein [Rhizobium redzepovicii]|uniref:hypothetical protein n=1 Tax=Rhizobium redzepovicii TaxID=2867518 RepID=UPI002870B4E0|nr:hypothetical protein [Rhizobium redzepovicii]MDR9779600.1 hypothetical protein [Rhizobium redzepovicii]
MEPTKDEIIRAAGYFHEANQLLAQRFNYSLVAHSMALTAYATCIGFGSANNPIVAALVAFFGAYYSIVQFIITHPLSKRIDALRAAYLMKDDVYLVYKNAVGGNRPRGVQSVHVPFVLFFCWALLFVYALVASFRLGLPF